MAIEKSCSKIVSDMLGKVLGNLTGINDTENLSKLVMERLAPPPQPAAIPPYNIDLFFMLAMGIFIYFMQTGFAMMEIGSVRPKNISNSIWKNVSYSFTSAFGYWVLGTAVSYGTDVSHFLGKSYWVLADLPAVDPNGTDLMTIFFQYVFCTTAGAVMTGAVAERAQLSCYIIYTLVASSLTYPTLVHWAWTSDGWLSIGGTYNISGEEVVVNYQDFAGSGVVHASGGVAALIAILFVGPRIGRFGHDGKVNDIPGNSLMSVGIGAMTLFTGFLAFNAGSQVAFSSNSDAEPINRATVNTIICGTGGFLAVSLLTRILYKRWLVAPMLCAGLAGNVAACCNCNVVESWAAFVIGLMAGLVYLFTSWLLKKLKIDDVVDAVGVHLGGGFVGVVGLAFFKIDEGIFYRWDKVSGLFLGWQLCGLFSICAWSAFNTWCIFYLMKVCNMVRVDPASELLGLDIAHGHEEGISDDNGLERKRKLENVDDFLKSQIEKYSLEHILNPGWSHPVYGAGYLDLSGLALVNKFQLPKLIYEVADIEMSNDANQIVNNGSQLITSKKRDGNSSV